MNYAKFATLLLIILLANKMVAQDKSTAILLTGVVVTGDSLTRLPFTNILITNKNAGTTSDNNGYFSFRADKNDTIVFSTVGFKKGRYIVPDSLNRNHYSIVQIMTNDTVYLQETIVYPWKSYEEFGEELVTMVPPPTDDDRARINLSNAQLYERYQNIYMDGEANSKYLSRLRSEEAYYAGQVPPFQIFNAFAWVDFIKSWKRGDYKKKG
jgi:hypothetical protein